MTWKKGQSGNPKGRAPGRTQAEELILALNRQAKKKKKPWLDHVAQQFYEDNKVMVAVLKKIIADKHHVDSDVKAELNVIIKKYGYKSSE